MAGGPRKFSEKIALLNQKEAEGNAAFASIMGEVKSIKSGTNSGSQLDMLDNLGGLDANAINSSIDDTLNRVYNENVSVTYDNSKHQPYQLPPPQPQQQQQQQQQILSKKIDDNLMFNKNIQGHQQQQQQQHNPQLQHQIMTNNSHLQLPNQTDSFRRAHSDSSLHHTVTNIPYDNNLQSNIMTNQHLNNQIHPNMQYTQQFQNQIMHQQPQQQQLQYQPQYQQMQQPNRYNQNPTNNSLLPNEYNNNNNSTTTNNNNNNNKNLRLTISSPNASNNNTNSLPTSPNVPKQQNKYLIEESNANHNNNLMPSYNLLFQPINQSAVLSASTPNYNRNAMIANTNINSNQLNQSFQHSQHQQQQHPQQQINNNYLNPNNAQNAHHANGGSLPDLTSFQYQSTQSQQQQQINQNNNKLSSNNNNYEFSNQLLQPMNFHQQQQHNHIGPVKGTHNNSVSPTRGMSRYSPTSSNTNLNTFGSRRHSQRTHSPLDFGLSSNNNANQLSTSTPTSPLQPPQPSSSIPSLEFTINSTQVNNYLSGSGNKLLNGGVNGMYRSNTSGTGNGSVGGANESLPPSPQSQHSCFNSPQGSPGPISISPQDLNPFTSNNYDIMHKKFDSINLEPNSPSYAYNNSNIYFNNSSVLNNNNNNVHNNKNKISNNKLIDKSGLENNEDLLSNSNNSNNLDGSSDMSGGIIGVGANLNNHHQSNRSGSISNSSSCSSTGNNNNQINTGLIVDELDLSNKSTDMNSNNGNEVISLTSNSSGNQLSNPINVNKTHKNSIPNIILSSYGDSMEEKNNLIIKDLSNDIIYNDDILIKNDQFDLDLQMLTDPVVMDEHPNNHNINVNFH